LTRVQPSPAPTGTGQLHVATCHPLRSMLPPAAHAPATPASYTLVTPGAAQQVWYARHYTCSLLSNQQMSASKTSLCASSDIFTFGPRRQIPVPSIPATMGQALPAATRVGTVLKLDAIAPAITVTIMKMTPSVASQTVSVACLCDEVCVSVAVALVEWPPVRITSFDM
jgi:hypothetical protein